MKNTKSLVTVSNTGEGKRAYKPKYCTKANTTDYEIKDVTFTKSEADNLTYNIRGLTTISKHCYKLNTFCCS